MIIPLEIGAGIRSYKFHESDGVVNYMDDHVNVSTREWLNVEIYKRIKQGVNIRAFDLHKYRGRNVKIKILVMPLDIQLGKASMGAHNAELSKDPKTRQYFDDMITFNFYGENAADIIHYRGEYIELIGRKGIEKHGKDFKKCITVSEFVPLKK